MLEILKIAKSHNIKEIIIPATSKALSFWRCAQFGCEYVKDEALKTLCGYGDCTILRLPPSAMFPLRTIQDNRLREHYYHSLIATAVEYSFII